MSAERSAKRRKINPADTVVSEQIQASQRLVGTKSNKSTATRGTKEKKTNGVHEPQADTAGPYVARRGTPRSAHGQSPANTSLQPANQDIEEDASGSTEDEIVVRSSGRARRLPAKLKEEEHILSSRAANTRTKPKSRTPATVQATDKTVLESPGRDVQMSTPASTPGTAKRKRTTKIGKENVTPPRTAEVGAEPIAAVPDAVASAHISTHKRLERRVQQPDIVANSVREHSEVHDHATDGRKISARALASLRKELLARATGRQTFPQVDRDVERTKVASLVKQAIETGESNSMLLIGSRGTGKTALVNEILRAQQTTHADAFHIVRLNGFIHTDDKLALRDIWRQLGREMKLEDKDTDVRSYADTLSMLLALLSRPQELDQSTDLDQVTKSVIFILDEFDLFATHPRQTLLYNLFDIAQSRKAPIAVIGLTTRVDVVEALEKRVKSRFSHRYVHLAPAKNLEAFIKICKATLTLPDDAQNAEHWNAAVESLVDNEHLALHIRKIYHRSKSVPDFLTTMLMPLGLLPISTTMTIDDIVEHFETTISMGSLGQDSKLNVLSALSTLQLALLICAARQNAIYATENISFNVAYEEYKAIAGKAKLQATASGALGAGSRVWGKDVAKSAWSDLVGFGLIMEDGRGIGKVDIALEEIADSNIELGQWARWCKEI